MAKPKAEPDPDPVSDPADPEPVDADPGDAGPDPEAFLKEVEARAHKGASEGFKTALDEWSKQVVEETDLDAIDAGLKEKNGPAQRPGGTGGSAPAGGAGRRAGASGSSIVQDAIAILVGRPRIPPGEA